MHRNSHCFLRARSFLGFLSICRVGSILVFDAVQPVRQVSVTYETTRIDSASLLTLSLRGHHGYPAAQPNPDPYA